MNYEISSVDIIITPWFSILIHDLGDEYLVAAVLRHCLTPLTLSLSSSNCRAVNKQTKGALFLADIHTCENSGVKCLAQNIIFSSLFKIEKSMTQFVN
jgi:hypothetical protein